MIANILKHILSRNTKSRIKLLSANFNSRSALCELRKDDPQARFILFGTPIHGNIGDHLIADSIVKYLHQISETTQIHEIPMDLYCAYKAKVLSSIHRQDIVLICGGGWLGSLWPHEEATFHDIVGNLFKNHIVVFPQTIFYDLDNEKAMCMLESARENLKYCQKLIFTLRETSSYNFALKNFGIDKDKVLLLPDMALTYECETQSNEKPNYDILLCLRSDREKILTDDDCQVLQSLPSCFAIRETDTVIKQAIHPSLRSQFINQKIREFQDAKLVITDRLHGMLFSVLAGTPCIALNNKTSKVANVHSAWINGKFPNIILTEKIGTGLKVKIAQLLSVGNTKFDAYQFKVEFDELTKKMRGFL